MHPGFREVRRQQWIKIIQACENRPAGMTIVQWTRENNVSVKSYQYWKHKLRLEALDQLNTSEAALLSAAPDKTADLPSCPSERSVTFTEVPLTVLKQQNSVSAPTAFSPDAVVNVSGIAVGFSNTASAELIDRILKAVTYAG